MAISARHKMQPSRMDYASPAKEVTHKATGRWALGLTARGISQRENSPIASADFASDEVYRVSDTCSLGIVTAVFQTI